MAGKAVASSKAGPSGKKYAPRLSTRKLTRKHVHAATLQAEGKLTVPEICKAVGITHNQLEKMRTSQLYRDEVDRQVTIFRNRLDGSILGQKTQRNVFREKLVKKLVHIVTKRAQNCDTVLEQYGGRTGLIVKKPVGRGRTALEVDHPTIERFQSLMNDIAKENGEMGAGNANVGVAVTIVLSQEDQMAFE